MSKRLSTRARLFAEHLSQLGLMRQSAILAGYSANGASATATRLMQRAEVRAYYESLLQEQFQSGTMISKNAIRARLVTIANSPTSSVDQVLKCLDMLNKMGQYYRSPIDKLAGLSPDEVREVISQATTKPSGRPLQIEG